MHVPKYTASTFGFIFFCKFGVSFVVKVGSVATYADQEFRVHHLEFDGHKGKAFATLVCNDNEDVTARMPAIFVKLACDDYLKVCYIYIDLSNNIYCFFNQTYHTTNK